MALIQTRVSRNRDKTHWLYLAVVAAVAIGVLVGMTAPGTAVQLKPLGDSFVSLV
jgi:aerobic C4-dicarboxylate transport protein